MSGKALFAQKGRRLAVLGAAGLGTCALLAACSPVQVGSAAIVGNQRITVSTLDTQVSNLQTAIRPYGAASQLTSATEPRAVLSWLIRFAVWDQVAAANGISVTPAQGQAALNSLTSVAQQNSLSSTAELLIVNGVPPQLFQQVGRWEAEQDAYALKVNGGKEPTTAEDSTVSAAVDKAQCAAAGRLNISVSPQYGRFDYASSSFSVVAGSYTLSKPKGTPSAPSTAGLTPAAC